MTKKVETYFVCDLCESAIPDCTGAGVKTINERALVRLHSADTHACRHCLDMIAAQWPAILKQRECDRNA